LTGNPLAMMKQYRTEVLSALPRLRSLDDHEVSREERAAVTFGSRAMRNKTSRASAEESADVSFEVRVEEFTVEPEPVLEIPVADEPENAPGGPAEASSPDGEAPETRAASGDGDGDGDGDGVGDGDANENGDGETSRPRDECEFWIRIRLPGDPENHVSTPRIRRSAPLVRGEAEDGERPAGDIPGDEEGGDAFPSSSTPFFANASRLPVSVSTRDAFVEGLVLELWRREPRVVVADEDGSDDASPEGVDPEREQRGDAEERSPEERGEDSAAETAGEARKGEPPKENSTPPFSSREYVVGTAIVRLPSFVNTTTTPERARVHGEDGEGSPSAVAVRIAFTPKPPLFRETNRENARVYLLEDAPKASPVGFATVTCTLHPRRERIP
jgi:hypothetical protein